MLPLHRRLMLRIVGTLIVLLVLMMNVAKPPPARLTPSALAPIPAPAPAITTAAAPPQDAVAEPLELPAPAIVVPPPVPVSAAQAAVARWVGAKYHVAPEAIAPLVVEADKLSAQYHLSPQLLIAVMAIESNFHPYIQSEAGAQGLMQVMPSEYARRYDKFGGQSKSVDPVVSLTVGAEILSEGVKRQGGSETEALRYYLGGGPAGERYIDKVRAEQRRLVQAAAGGHPPVK